MDDDNGDFYEDDEPFAYVLHCWNKATEWGFTTAPGFAPLPRGPKTVELRQVFTCQPWRSLWWIDARLHRSLLLTRLLRPTLCRVIDRKIWRDHRDPDAG